MIFAKALMQNGRLDFSPAVQTLLNPENAHMIGNSLLLGVLVVLLSTLIAAPLAYLFSRTNVFILFIIDFYKFYKLNYYVINSLFFTILC